MGHTRKILSQAGTSLADIYDVEGSVVGLDALSVEEIQGVHELGGTIHSERLSVFHRNIASDDELQNVAFNTSMSGFPDSINRILGIFVVASVASRVAFVTLSIGDPATGREHIIWAWDETADAEGPVRWDDGSGAANISGLRTLAGPLGTQPNLLVRTGARWRMPSMVMRGLTNGFGAGNVTVTAQIMLCRPDRSVTAPGDPNSRGLPIPSW